MATFAYLRVSTSDQTTDNQMVELAQAGYQIDYWFADVGVSGKAAAAQRPEFRKMLDRIREGETLVVSKIDRLGRDAIDVLQTIRSLEERKVKVIVHQLGAVDLTSTVGKMMLAMLSAMAEMERDLLVERTQAGLARAKAEGKKLGRPARTTPAQNEEILAQLANNISVSELARRYDVSRSVIIGIKSRAAQSAS